MNDITFTTEQRINILTTQIQMCQRYHPKLTSLYLAALIELKEQKFREDLEAILTE